MRKVAPGGDLRDIFESWRREDGQTHTCHSPGILSSFEASRLSDRDTVIRLPY